jgi:hypothetical protein
VKSDFGLTHPLVLAGQGMVVASPRNYHVRQLGKWTELKAVEESLSLRRIVSLHGRIPPFLTVIQERDVIG